MLKLPSPLAGQIALLFTLTCHATLFAQNNSVFRLPPREATTPLARAKRAMDDDRYTEAVQELSPILAAEQPRTDDPFDVRGQDFFLTDTTSNDGPSTLKQEAMRLLASSREMRQAYERLRGPEARELLKGAIERGDIEQVAEVTRRFFHTQAGYEAALLLGRYELDQGRPLAAAFCLDRVAQSPVASSLDPDLSLLLANCWYFASVPQKAQTTLVGLRDRMGGKPLSIAGKQVDWFAENSEALEWLAGVVGAKPSIRSAQMIQWVMFRGNARRNATTQGDMPVLRRRWYSTIFPVHDPIPELNKSLVNKQTPPIPGISPLAVGDTIITRSFNLVVGLDFAEGGVIWTHPPDGAVDELDGSGQKTDVLNKQVEQRIWQDMPYGQMSSNGEFVFFLDDLFFPASSSRPVNVRFGGVRVRQMGAPKAHNMLKAVDIAEEGKLKWQVGGPRETSDFGGDDAPLAGAFFLGPPLPVNNDVYVLAEVNGEIRLVMLDAKNGRLKWWQQVAHVADGVISRDFARRLGGATPSMADGLLICPTSAGAVVAVDIVSRQLKWGFTYGRPVSGRQGIFMQPSRGLPFGQGWVDGTATIADGRVIVTPIDSQRIYCLDLLTGKSLWSTGGTPGMAREGMIFVAAVQDGHVVLVGKNSVRALKLEDGSPAWTKADENGNEQRRDVPLSAEQNGLTMPSGRGFVSAKSYFLPTTASELLEIDIQTGMIQRRADTGRPLGNLFCYRDHVVAQNPEGVWMFYQRKPLETRVAERLKADANDTWAMARRSELLLQDNKQTEALAVLRRAYELTAAEDDEFDAIKSLLVQTLLAALQDDFAANREFAVEVAGLIDEPDQHADFLRLMAVGHQQANEPVLAAKQFLKLADLNKSLLDDESRDDIEELSSDHRVRRERWIQSRLHEVVSSANASQRAEIDALIQTRFDETLKAESTARVNRYVEQFGFHPSAAEMRLHLADRFQEMGQSLKAELLLAPLASSEDQAMAGRATARLARVLEKSGRVDLAAPVFARLNDRWKNVKLDGASGGELWEAAQSREAVARQLRPHVWPAGEVDVEQSQPLSNSPYQRVVPIVIQEAGGNYQEGLDVELDQRISAVVVRDPFGNQICKVAVTDSQRGFGRRTDAWYNGKLYGNLLVVRIGSELIAIDLLQGGKPGREAVLWRHPINETASGGSRSVSLKIETANTPFGYERKFATSNGNLTGQIAVVAPTGVVYQDLNGIVCVDPLSGKLIWSREDLTPGSLLFGDEQYVFVLPNGSPSAEVLSVIDGRKVGEREVASKQDITLTHGRRVLSWREDTDAGKLDLVLRDGWSQQVIWTESLSMKTRAAMLDDEIAILEPGGRFLIRSLINSARRVEQSLSVPVVVSALHVLRSSEQYLVMVARTTGEQGLSADAAPAGAPLVRGPLFALSRRTGRPLWRAPATISQFGFPLDQSAESPVVVFLRHVNHTSGDLRGKTTSSLFCLDRRDGRTVLLEEDIPSQTHVYHVNVNRETNTVQIATTAKKFDLKFTDRPIPPAPPAQTVILSIIEQTLESASKQFKST